MHFGIGWGIKQKEFLVEKSKRNCFDNEFGSLGSPIDQNALLSTEMQYGQLAMCYSGSLHELVY